MARDPGEHSFGPEFVTMEPRQWLAKLGTETLYIEPGSPWENGYCESFKGKLREAQVVTEKWRREYDESWPHRALGERTPNEFANEIAASRDFIGMQTAENSP